MGKNTIIRKDVDEYAQAITICVNNVGSKSIAVQRKRLRALNVHVLMGKNTIIRKVLNLRAERLEAAGNTKAAEQTTRMLEMVQGNIGFVFIPSDADVGKIREMITSERVQTAAKAGIAAPDDVVVPAGPTGQDPSQTTFFQALDIPTKINRGQVEIVSDVKLITKGEKVNRSAAELLVMLNIKPFYYGITVHHIYQNGDVFPAAVLDISASDIAQAFSSAVREVAALCLALNYPTAASAPAAGDAGGAAAAAPVEEEEEEEESSAAAGGMFGGSSSDDDSDEDSDEDSS